MDNGNDKRRVAELRAKRCQQRFEQERERNSTRQFGGHFFPDDEAGARLDAQLIASGLRTGTLLFIVLRPPAPCES